MLKLENDAAPSLNRKLIRDCVDWLRKKPKKQKERECRLMCYSCELAWPQAREAIRGLLKAGEGSAGITQSERKLTLHRSAL